MAIIIAPTLTAFTEFDMLSSRAFKNAKHQLVSLWIRNHNKQTKSTFSAEHTLPKEVLLDNQEKVYRERVNENREIKVKITGINPKGGIEILQEHLEETHPGIDFYVLEMVTQTIQKGEQRHNLLWQRKPASQSNSKIVSLHLTQIDGLLTMDNFSQEEMWKIAGALPDDKCRLRTGVKEQSFIVCDPVTN